MISSWEKTRLLPDPKCMNIIGERERANLVVQLARIFFLYGSCRNVLRICKYTTNKILHHVVIMSSALVHAFMQAVNTFMQAINAFMQAFMQASSSLRPPGVVWNELY